MPTTDDGAGKPQTHFAPAERTETQDLHAARDSVLAGTSAGALLEAIPELVMVLNQQRQIVAMSRHLLRAMGHETAEEIVGLRPGELLGCVHAHECPGGCGTSPSCSVCGATLAIVQCLQQHRTVEHECRITTRDDAGGNALDLRAQATYMELGAAAYVVLTLQDISDQKRRLVLERAFFHDVLNIAGGLQALAELLSIEDDDAAEEEYKQDLHRLSAQIIAEIRAHRELLAAESGELEVNLRPVGVAEALRSVAELYRHHMVAEGRHITVVPGEDADVLADPVLLQRVLGNLVKNALEATPEGGTVSLAAEIAADHILFRVSNPGVMPEDVQKQIFQRSFSTKGGTGRGIGTHSVKLLSERYMGGQVSFQSREPQGTTFTVKLPRAEKG